MCLLLMLACAVAVVAGCVHESADSRVAAMNDSNIRRLANLYNAFQVRKGMKGPKDEAEFKHFIQQEYSPEKLQRMQVDPQNVDALFTSERDGEPFVIRYGVSGGLSTVDPVVFEQKGVGGKRQVAFTGGTVEEVDDSRYDQLLSGSASKSGT
jgi:hypothetical protein